MEGHAAAPDASERPEFRRAHLATLFLRATRPLPTAEIVEQVYNNPDVRSLDKGELSLDSARKALKRDLDALAACGIVVESCGKDEDGQSLWQVNRELSFTQGIALSEEDAAFLDIACLPLLNDPGFPERDELRLALAKIDRLFDAAATDALTASSMRDSAVLATVREAIATRTALDIAYTPREGGTAMRRVAPLAFFDLRSVLYVVCARIDADGTLVPGSERTYRVDRISSAKRLERLSFEVPASFDVRAFRKLPFQMGSEAIACAFFVPEAVSSQVAAASYGKGTFLPAEGGTLWQVDAASLDDAAAWAIAFGIRPTAPQELISAWRARLEEAAHG